MNPYCACVRCKAHRAVHRVSDARLMALGGFWAARIWVRDFLIHVPAPSVGIGQVLNEPPKDYEPVRPMTVDGARVRVNPNAPSRAWGTWYEGSR